MKRARRGPSLFEAMSKVPQAQNPRRRPGLLSWRRRRMESSPLVVAEPLTEEEAAAELAAQRAAEETARHDEVAQRRAAKQEAAQRRAAKKEAASRPSAGAAETDDVVAPLVSVTGGRLVLSLNTVGCIFVSALVCVLALGAYSLGQRSAGRAAGGGLAPAAAPRKGAESPGSPLLPGGLSQQERAKRDQAAARKRPDLSALLKQPSSSPPGSVGSNRPARVVPESPQDGAAAAELNYLQIETFRITRERSGEQIREDVAEVQAFLKNRGVETFARRRSNYYVLFSEQGYPPGAEHAAERKAFRVRIADLGQAYRRSGGPYQFKGCLFVSHSQTRYGRPG